MLTTSAKNHQTKVIPLVKNRPVPAYMPQQRKWKINLRTCFLAFFILWALYIFFFVQNPKLKQLEEEKEQLRQQLVQQGQKQQELNAEINNLNNNEYIALLARQYNMVKQGEIVYQPGQ